MPYNMEYYYSKSDKTAKINVKVYDFACVGQLCPSALVFTLDGREPNSQNSEMPEKNKWMLVSLDQLKPVF